MSKRADAVVDIAVRMDSIVERGNAAIRKAMSPKGTLKLPKLLEARRWEFLIPDGCFKMHALYDRILVAQLPEYESKTFTKGGVVLMTDQTQAAKEDASSRGIILSAGLKALDNLKSNGCDLGHIVRFVRYAPWNITVDNVEGHDIYDMVLRDGDLVASEDLAAALKKGECRVEYDEANAQHMYVDKKGKRWTPSLPWIADDL